MRVNLAKILIVISPNIVARFGYINPISQKTGAHFAKFLNTILSVAKKSGVKSAKNFRWSNLQILFVPINLHHKSVHEKKLGLRSHSRYITFTPECRPFRCMRESTGVLSIRLKKQCPARAYVYFC